MMPCSCAASTASAICFAIGQRLLDGNRPLRNSVSERRSLDQLHHERNGTVVFFQAVHVRDVWMIKRGENLRFALEAGESFRVRCESVGKDLQRIIPLQRNVVRSPDLAHTALAEGRRHLVRTESGAGSERHTAGILRDCSDVGGERGTLKPLPLVGSGRVVRHARRNRWPTRLRLRRRWRDPSNGSEHVYSWCRCNNSPLVRCQCLFGREVDACSKELCVDFAAQPSGTPDAN
jgi:hypothetical protein